jgi:DNA-binding transcriptional regulator YbjK
MTARPAARKRVTRRLRGTERRQEIIDATLRLVAREGTGALTHRKVAREAGVPLAATTYYFDSKEALLQETLSCVAEGEIDRLRRLTPSAKAGRDATKLLLDAFVGDYSSSSESGARTQLAQYELFLEAARRPQIRPVARAWTRAYLDLSKTVFEKAGSAQPALDARIFVAMIDGLFLEQVAMRTPGFEKRVVAPAVRRFTALISRGA